MARILHICNTLQKSQYLKTGNFVKFLSDKIYGSREGHSAKLRRTRSEVSPNTVLPRFAEVISETSPNSLRRFAEVTSEASPMLRRTQLRYFAEVTSEASPNSLRGFAEVTSEASPKSPPKLRRTQLRYFAEVTSEASPKHTLQRHISSCTSTVAHYRISTYVTTRLAKLSVSHLPVEILSAELHAT